MKELNLQKSEAYLPWLVIAFSITGLLIGHLHEKFGRMDEAVRYYKMAIKESCGRTTGKAS
ncbi:MAG: hypothetical protein D4R56_01080 [Deltaproteobacteria bacterium]|nr:MAG: hypothetical protein D4R56_01080 [Deltaproteobacteria bacterium]